MDKTICHARDICFRNRRVTAHRRNRRLLDQARSAGVLGPTKNTRLSGGVSTTPVEAAKRSAHVSSDSELLELALSRLALDDDFGPRLLRLKGTIAADIDLEL